VYSPSNIITVLSNIVVVVEILQTRSDYETGQTICVEKMTHTSSSETLKPFYQLSVRRTRDRTGRRTQGIARQNQQGDRFGGKAGSGCLLKGSPSTTRFPRYRNPVATRRSGSPSRAHRPDSQSEGRRGEHRSTPVNCGRSKCRSVCASYATPPNYKNDLQSERVRKALKASVRQDLR
jgi:hypothetical protein